MNKEREGSTKMRFTKKKGCNDTIRKVWNDDKTKCYGVVGTVRDLIVAGILTYCDYSAETWVFIGRNGAAVFGATRDDVLKGIA